MKNILDYAEQDVHTFDQRPFNAVDALVLACLSYQDMPAIVPGLQTMTAQYGTWRSRLAIFDITHPLTSLRRLGHAPFVGPTLSALNDHLQRHDFADNRGHQGLTNPHLTQRLYAAVARNPRFCAITVSAFDRRFSAERQTQFAAQTFRLPDGTLAIAFQGTDDSFVGWKEDFNMAFQYPVPAQESAADYVETVAGLWPGPIMVLGHSKGGNLAIYAAMNVSAKVRERITRIYCLDGPGFPAEIVHGETYRSITGVMEKIVPTSSIVGMILETPEPCIVVQSDQRGIMQHMPFSWQVNDGHFVQLPEISPGSQYFNTELNSWLRSLSPGQRRRAVDALFTILNSTGADGFSSMMSTFPRVLPEMIGSFAGLSDEDRRYILFAANLLLRARFTAPQRNTGAKRAPAHRVSNTGTTA